MTRRRHDEAVRLAVGANYRQVLPLVFPDAALLVGVGVIVAAPGIYITGRFIRGVLLDMSPLDPSTLTAAVLALALVTVAACYMPARRCRG